MWAYHVLRVVKLQYQLIAKAGQQSQDTFAFFSTPHIYQCRLLLCLMAMHCTEVACSAVQAGSCWVA